ncbi:hypothetical protein V1605_03000 [Enterobacter soli]|uniref:hypothetical protein n=1 Tax=Enterobacter TaxID=547 RepID=UPI001C251790|nr:hypothetical protein [Enterobacter soli]HED3853717.1 hypothetical protein [Enterobacter soli]
MLPLWTVAPGNGCGKVDVSAGVPAVRKIFSCGNGGRKGSAYIKDVAEAMRKGGDIEPKNLLLTCGKSFIHEGSSDYQNKTLDYLIDTLSSYEQKQ